MVQKLLYEVTILYIIKPLIIIIIIIIIIFIPRKNEGGKILIKVQRGFEVEKLLLFF